MRCNRMWSDSSSRHRRRSSSSSSNCCALLPIPPRCRRSASLCPISSVLSPTALAPAAAHPLRRRRRRVPARCCRTYCAAPAPPRTMRSSGSRSSTAGSGNGSGNGNGSSCIISPAYATLAALRSCRSTIAACHRHRHRRVALAEAHSSSSSSCRRDAPPPPRSTRPCVRSCCCSRLRRWRISSIIRSSIAVMQPIIMRTSIITGMCTHTLPMPP